MMLRRGSRGRAVARSNALAGSCGPCRVARRRPSSSNPCHSRRGRLVGVHLFQSTSAAPAGSRDRNDTMIRERFVDHRPSCSITPCRSRPTTNARPRRPPDRLEHLAGTPARLDLIQLGLGDDGHTASLVPDDPVLKATTDVAVTAGYKGTRRWTMTAPLINRARERLFLVTGTEKDAALQQLAAGDPGIPGSLITGDQTFLATDRQIPGFSTTPW